MIENSMTWIDTHAHLDQADFHATRAEALSRAAAAGVEAILVVATTADSARECVQIARDTKSPRVYAAVGIHPNYAAQAQPDDWEKIVALAREPHVKALGETGLDRHWDDTPFPLQQDYFARHLDLSAETKLPVVIHVRDCEADVRDMLRAAHARHGTLQGVLHSFCGSWETARECLDLGLYISFAGMLTFKKSGELRELAKKIPRDRLLVETDCPYLSPEPFRGKHPNEPARVIHTGTCLAQTVSLSVEELAALTTENARRLFSFDH